MRKNFWPLFVIVAALGSAAIWTQTPRYVTMMPDGMRREFRSYERSAQGLGDIKAQIAAQTEDKDKPVTLLGGGTAPAATNVPDVSIVPVVSTAPAASAAPATPRFAAPADIKGIKVVDVASAEWCVLMRSTPIEALDEKPLGNASGGRFFLIERRARAANTHLPHRRV